MRTKCPSYLATEHAGSRPLSLHCQFVRADLADRVGRCLNITIDEVLNTGIVFNRDT